eukprot:13151907-Ditylum_brightwellii.AAC.1
MEYISYLLLTWVEHHRAVYQISKDNISTIDMGSMGYDFFVIPILSLLMLMYEHSALGSVYPLTVPPLVNGQQAKLHKVAQKHVPVTSH